MVSKHLCSHAASTLSLGSSYDLGFQVIEVPSGELTYELNMAIYSGFSHEKWWFSIAFCMFTRGYVLRN